MENGNGVESETMDQIHPVLLEVEEFLNQSKARQQKLKQTSTWLSVAILVVFLVFIMLFYQLFKTNMSADKFSKSMQAGVSEVAPVITDATIEVFAQVSPLYLDLAQKKVETMMPTIVSSLDEQSKLFIANIAEFSEAQFKGSLERIVDKMALDFRKEYPDLTDEQISMFVANTDKQFQELIFELANNILEETLPGIMEMKYRSETIAEGVDRNRSSVEFSQLFLHKLLLLLDREIMEGE